MASTPVGPRAEGKAPSKALTGTREWAGSSFNCVTGCSHNCRYCYARDMAVRRFGRVSSVEEWATPVLRPTALSASRRFYPGGVMFPTTHDILPETLDLCLTALANLLAAGNTVLVVSKPHLLCIKALCERFASYATPGSPNDSPLRLRFTIGAADEELLRFWEPGAPSFAERFECLRLAHARGFSTSISMEPLLDPANAVALVGRLLPHVTDTIWLGLMNRAKERCVFEVPEQEPRLSELLAVYASPLMRELAAALKGEAKVRWKRELRLRLGMGMDSGAVASDPLGARVARADS